MLIASFALQELLDRSGLLRLYREWDDELDTGWEMAAGDQSLIGEESKLRGSGGWR